MINNQHKQFRRRGSVLLLALLVMAGLITAGIGIGAIILNEIRQARNIDFAVLAYYAAESGAEGALHKLRKEDAVLTCPAGECQPSGYCLDGETACLYSEGTLTNYSTWERSVQDRELIIYGEIEKNKVLQIDLYDPNQIAWAAGIESVKVEWQDSCGDGSWIELAFTSWTPGASVMWEDNRIKYQYSAPESPIINNRFSSSKAYRVRIKALYCDINNLTFTAWGENNAGGEQKEIPSRIILTSRGAFGPSTQAIRITMLRKSPMSGLYDYVLFSECSLVKGEEPACP